MQSSVNNDRLLLHAAVFSFCSNRASRSTIFFFLLLKIIYNNRPFPVPYTHCRDVFFYGERTLIVGTIGRNVVKTN